jgi:hypothetical protein
MRRWIFMAALATALFATPLWAQRGGHGGMAGGGHGGGFAGHGSGYVAHGGGGYVGAAHGGAYWGGGYHGGYWHGYPGHYPHYPGRYPWWGYRGYGYGWYGYPWFSLGWYWGGGYSDAYYAYPATSYPVYVSPYADDNTSVDYKQQKEIDQLNDEVARLRAEQQSGAAAKPAPQPPPKAQVNSETVLVFRDRHSEEIENYAVVGKTLWVFTEQRARKIPITELNVPATTKANEARGIDFRLPQ